MSAAQCKNQNVGWDRDYDTDIDLDEFLSAYLEDRDSVGSLGEPLSKQERMDDRYDEVVPLRKYWKQLFRDGDVPDYEEFLDEGTAESEYDSPEYVFDIDELDLGDLAPDNYEDLLKN